MMKVYIFYSTPKQIQCMLLICRPSKWLSRIRKGHSLAFSPHWGKLETGNFLSNKWTKLDLDLNSHVSRRTSQLPETILTQRSLLWGCSRTISDLNEHLALSIINKLFTIITIIFIINHRWYITVMIIIRERNLLWNELSLMCERLPLYPCTASWTSM